MCDSYINMLSSLIATAEKNRNDEGGENFEKEYKEESGFEYEFRRVSFH